MFNGRIAAAAWLLFFLALTAHAQESFTWKAQPGAGQAAVQGGILQISLAAPGQSSVGSAPLPVKAGAAMALTFQYTAQNLDATVPLSVSVHWLDAQGADVDAARAQIGFPPLARFWSLTKSSKTPTAFADNLTVPANAVRAVVRFGLARAVAGTGVAAVTITGATLSAGPVAPTGTDLPDSGPADAGPLSQPVPGVRYGANLVPNAALEDGEQAPTGWKVQGDNTRGAATWQQGGAFSGRHCLKVSDTGPFLKSWGEDAASGIYVPGHAPDGGYADARAEVSARWASDPMPAVPGQAYQATAFVWYANRQYLDRGEASPVRVHFLDKDGRTLPNAEIHDDWLNSNDPFEAEGWVPIVGKPLVVPKGAASVRVEVVLQHSFFSSNDGLTVVERPNDRRFVLVDNVSLYRVRTRAPLTATAPDNRPTQETSQAAWQETADSGALPFVPTSAGFRPNSLRVQAETGHAGGIIFVPAPAGRPDLLLRLSNVLGDRRAVRIEYHILNKAGASLGAGVVTAAVPPFRAQTVALKHPAGLPLGPYSVQYAVHEGGKQVDAGETRFALLPTLPPVPVGERARMDYPFSLWAPAFSANMGTDYEKTAGPLMDAAGMGKTWFGCGGAIYLDQFLNMEDDAAREAAVAKRIGQAREAIAVWRRYHVVPLGQFEPAQHALTPAEMPRFTHLVAEFVSALKGDIHAWRYGTEYMHGGITQLDVAQFPPGQTNVQGSRNYLNWGRTGTVRQYYTEYLAAYAAAKNADPSCLFGPQSAGDINGDVARLFFLVGTKNQLDSFGMNTYINAHSIWPSNEAQLSKNGAPDLPLYISEFSAQNGCKPLGPAHYADENDAVRRMVSYWADVLYSFPNFFDMEQWGMVLGNDDGSLTSQNRVRPQYVAYATMTRTLGAGRFVAHPEVPQAEVYVRRRTMPPGLAGVLWSSGAAGHAELEVGVPSVTVSDVYGNTHALKAQGGIVDVPLTPMPQYLLGAKVIRAARTVEMTFSPATTDPAEPRLAVVVTNRTANAVTGTLTVRASLPLRPASLAVRALAGGETRRILFDAAPPAPSQDRRLVVQGRLTSQTRTYRSDGAVNFHTAARAATPPAIDGDLSDWPQPFTLAADRADQFGNGFGSPKPWGGPSDISGRLSFRWDDKNLYIAARVTDDVFAPPALPGQMFASDCIEMLVDVHRGLKGSSPFEMFTLAQVGGQGQVNRYDGALPKGQVTDAGISVRRVEGETDYEAVLPWTEIDPAFTPQAGETISLAWSLDDSDGPGTGRRCLSWFSLASAKNPAEFGDLTLTDASAP